jgi:zinc transporter 1/2/3
LGVLNHSDEVVMLFIAIIAHKWAESFALGISFYKAKIDAKIFIKMLTLFTFFTPVGILIGMYFSKSGFLIEGIMLSISSGTFVYVSTSEVIVEEFSSKGSKHLKYFIYLLGGFLTVLLNFLDPAPIIQ